MRACKRFNEESKTIVIVVNCLFYGKQYGINQQ